MVDLRKMLKSVSKIPLTANKTVFTLAQIVIISILLITKRGRKQSTFRMNQGILASSGNYLIYLLFLLSSFYGVAQSALKGVVTNPTGQPLPFVNVLINNSRTDGVTTDIDGKFSIPLEKKVQVLTFSYIGYELLQIDLSQYPKEELLQVELQPTAYAFEEVVVRAGENPAERIIKKAVKNRKINHPENLDAYKCQTYNKMAFSFVPNEKKYAQVIAKKDTSKERIKKQHQKIQKFFANTQKHHLLLIESVTERQFQAPGKYSEEILHNRVSGLKEAPFAALANAIQPFSFYEEYLDILDRAFLNPISKGSTKKYFFHLEDTLIKQTDTIFIISFHPRKGKKFESLKGFIYINTNKYAIQNVVAEPSDTSFINVRIEQQYQLIDNQQWFPEQLNFVLEAKKYPAAYIGMEVYGRSYVQNVQINPEVDTKLLQRNESYTFREKAHHRNDSIWQLYRHENLSIKESNTYVKIDSLGIVKKFDKRLRQLEALASGRINFGLFDLSIPKIISFNSFESVRLGIGLYTSPQLSKSFELGGYAGYGFKDKAWKYGGSLNLNLHSNKDIKLLFSYRKDLREPAVAWFPINDQLFSRRLFANRMDRWEEQKVQLTGQFLPYFWSNITLSHNDWSPDYGYRFQTDTENPQNFKFTEFEFHLRYAYRQRFVRFLGLKIPESTSFPVVELGYIRGFGKLLEGAYPYNKIITALEQSFRTRHIGETHYRIEAGWVDRKLPFAKLFTSSGYGRDFQFLTIGNSFQTMDQYEFVSDRFVHFFFRHNFGTILIRSKKFRPEIAIEHNVGFGQLRNREAHQGIDFKTMERGYFEGGLVAENLLLLNYFNFAYIGLGAGVYYRYGPYALPKKSDNVAFRMSLSFTY